MSDASCDPSAQARLRALGQAIRHARGGLTQAELGLRLGVPQATVSRWELGRCGLGVEQVHAIEEALDLRAGELLAAGGYVDGDELPGPILRRIESTDPDLVVGLIRAAFALDLGIRVTNRWKPTSAFGDGEVTWTVVTSGVMPGDDA